MMRRDYMYNIETGTTIVGMINDYKIQVNLHLC